MRMVNTGTCVTVLVLQILHGAFRAVVVQATLDSYEIARVVRRPMCVRGAQIAATSPTCTITELTSTPPVKNPLRRHPVQGAKLVLLDFTYRSPLSLSLPTCAGFRV